MIALEIHPVNAKEVRVAVRRLPRIVLGKAARRAFRAGAKIMKKGMRDQIVQGCRVQDSYWHARKDGDRGGRSLLLSRGAGVWDTHDSTAEIHQGRFPTECESGRAHYQ